MERSFVLYVVWATWCKWSTQHNCKCWFKNCLICYASKKRCHFCFLTKNILWIPFTNTAKMSKRNIPLYFLSKQRDCNEISFETFRTKTFHSKIKYHSSTNTGQCSTKKYAVKPFANLKLNIHFFLAFQIFEVCLTTEGKIVLNCSIQFSEDFWL